MIYRTVCTRIQNCATPRLGIAVCLRHACGISRMWITNIDGIFVSSDIPRCLPPCVALRCSLSALTLPLANAPAGGMKERLYATHRSSSRHISNNKKKTRTVCAAPYALCCACGRRGSSRLMVDGHQVDRHRERYQGRSRLIIAAEEGLRLGWRKRKRGLWIWRRST